MPLVAEAQNLISEYLLTGPAGSFLDETVPDEEVVQVLDTDPLNTSMNFLSHE